MNTIPVTIIAMINITTIILTIFVDLSKSSKSSFGFIDLVLKD